MMKRYVVLDTNCVVQSISHRSRYRAVWDNFMRGSYLLCVSNEILNEYQEILERVANANVARNIVEAIVNSPFTRFYSPHFKFNLIENDYDDNKFVDCAIIANADYRVSEDAHFDILKTIPFPKVKVVGLDEFLAELLRVL